MKRTQSIEKYPFIIPGEYKGLWTAYYVKIIFHNGNVSEPIKLNDGVRGANCDCNVTVESDGQIYVE